MSLIKYAVDRAVRSEIEELEEIALCILSAGLSVDQFRIDTYTMPNGNRSFAIRYF
jgi:hypothetical protein